MISYEGQALALQVIVVLLYGSLDGQGFMLDCGVVLLHWCQFSSHIDHQVFFAIELLREDGSQSDLRCISLHQEGEAEIRIPQHWRPGEDRLLGLECSGGPYGPSYAVTQALGLGEPQVALLWVHSQPRSSELLQDLLHVEQVVLSGRGVYHHVIYVYSGVGLAGEEDDIHQPLECH